MVLPSIGDAVLAGGDLVRQIAQDGIVFQQMSQSLGVGKIVDRHEFDVAVIERSSKHVSPDASESVDAYFNSHFSSGSLTYDSDGNCQTFKWNENVNRELKNAANAEGYPRA